MVSAVVDPASIPQAGVQPDISYAPDFEKYQARTKQRLASGNLNSGLPEGFPRKLDSDLVWEGKDLEGAFQWVYELSEAEIQEIEDALKHFKC